MNAPVNFTHAETFPFIEVFREQCELHARLHAKGLLSKPTAIDHLQWLAETWHLVELHGQDAIQVIIAKPFSRIRYELVSDEPPDDIEPPKHAGTAQSTIDAFWYVVGLNDEDRLASWLANHRQDAPYLRKLLEGQYQPKSK